MAIRVIGQKFYPHVSDNRSLQIILQLTELNVDACNYNNTLNANHIAAVWFSDVIGRLAYNGINYVTMYTGYGIDGYSILYPDNETNPTKIMARPSYYPLLMYGQYFGDSMIESSSANESQVSVWASKDSTDPGAIKLMVTNISGTAASGKVILTGIAQGQVNTYQLTSTNPTDTGASSVTMNASTAINGRKVDAMNVNASLSQIQPVVSSLNDGQVILSLPAYTTTAVIIRTSGTGVTPTTGVSATPTKAPTNGPTATSTPGCTKKSAGDANCDGLINLADFEIYRREFTGAVSTKTADFDASGTVNIIDFEIFRRNYLAS